MKIDQNKLEKLENIKNYIENDDIAGLNKYVERIKPGVNTDQDFLDIFEELKNKDYDQALFLTEEIIFDVDEDDFVDDLDKMNIDDFGDHDDFILDDPEDSFDDFSDDNFDDLTFDEEKEDDFF